MRAAAKAGWIYVCALKQTVMPSYNFKCSNPHRTLTKVSDDQNWQ